MNPASNPAPVAYSYVRFSTSAQAEGDSLRRQTEAAKKWCEKNGVNLDPNLTLRDLGRSAYLGDHRKNPDRHALAAFLKLVEDGKVPRGSALIVESLDRLSREDIRPALTLLLNLIEAGIRVVQLIPAETVYDEHVEPMSLMMAIMELSRGHSESRVKSDRVGKAWKTKKVQARSGKVLTARLPAWVELHDGKMRLIPERAAIVRRIFELSAAGRGFSAIVTTFVREGVPPLCDFRPPLLPSRWVRSYVVRIVCDRRAVGEYRPHNRDGTPDGEIIPTYFPAVVTEGQFHAARAGAVQRRKRGLKALDSYTGRPLRRTRKEGQASVEKHPSEMPRNRFVNVFSGLIRDALDSDSYCVVQRYKDGVSQRVLVNSSSRDGRTVCRSFPYPAFETAVVKCLKEVKADDVLGNDNKPDELAVLAGEESANDTELAKLTADLEANGYSATLGNRVRVLEERRRVLAGQIATARQRAANPLSEAWGNAQSLLTAMENAPDPDDIRFRLRAVLARVVQGMSIIIVARGRPRLCTVQIAFASGVQRAYLILHDPTRANSSAVRQPAKLFVKSFAALPALDNLDLRNKADAAAVEKVLAALDPAVLTMTAPTADPNKKPLPLPKPARKVGPK